MARKILQSEFRPAGSEEFGVVARARYPGPVHTVNIAQSSPAQTGAQSVDRALSLLRRIARHPETGAARCALVAETRLNKPTMRRLMMALVRARLVEQDAGTRAYRLGEEPYVIGTLATARHGLLEIAADALSRLARSSEDTAFLTMRRGSWAVCLHREEGTHPIRTHALTAGARHPIGVGAGSLAMLARLADAEVDAAVEENAPALTAGYPSLPPEWLRALVEETRARGYALNAGLIVPGCWGAGVALCRADGSVAGALSLAAIEARMQPPRDAELARALKAEAALIETPLAPREAAPTPP